MKTLNVMRRHPWLSLVPGVLAGSLLCANCARATVIYQTGFEPSEGYDTNRVLVGQKGWLGAGSGGNGLEGGFFPGRGVQAFVGFSPPAAGDKNLFVYQPINKSLPQVQFSVTMAVIDSTNTNRDDFYWSVFNQQGQQLVVLDFDNFDLNIYYYLDNTNGRTWSGLSFTNTISYQLNMSLDYTSNHWTAFFGGLLLASNQPITTTRAPLNLGDIDAAWVPFDPMAPGNNFMVFDDYQISATAPQPQLNVLGILNGSPTLRVTGLADLSFAVEASTNLVNWLPLKTNLTTGGSFDYVDATGAGLPRRFYRARWAP
jgi:hypothetical protein